MLLKNLLKKEFGNNLYLNYPMKKLTTMAVGGPAKFLVQVQTIDDLKKAIGYAKKFHIAWCMIGEGSNLVVSDKGYEGLIIKNEIKYLEMAGKKVKCGAGNNLLGFIKMLNKKGWGGMERMAGIPGTVGGAIYGNAGAYGQEIKDHLRKVVVFDGKNFRKLGKSQCGLGYRESIFKTKKGWVILGAEFDLKKELPTKLQKISRDIIKLRETKYWPGLKCPGSFFIG